MQHVLPYAGWKCTGDIGRAAERRKYAAPAVGLTPLAQTRGALANFTATRAGPGCHEGRGQLAGQIADCTFARDACLQLDKWGASVFDKPCEVCQSTQMTVTMWSCLYTGLAA